MNRQTSPFKSGVLSAGLVVAGGMLLGRLAGFVREVVVAKEVGVSQQADLAILILTYPDFLMSVFIGGAMSAAFMPEILLLPGESHRSFFYKLLRAVGLSFFLLTIALIVASPLITWLLAPGLSGEIQDQASLWLKAAACATPFLALAALTRCFLQSRQRLGLISLENFAYNLLIIFGLIYIYPIFGLWGLVGLIVFGAVARFGSQWILVSKALTTSMDQPPLPKLQFSVLRRYVEALIAGTIIVALPYVARSFSSLTGEGGIALFNYSHKLIDLPTGLLTYAFTLVLLPRFTAAFQSSASQGAQLAQRGFCQLLMISSSFSLFLGWFMWGLLDQQTSFFNLQGSDLAQVALLSLIGLIGLPAKSLIFINSDIMNAQKDTRSPLLISAFGLGLALPVFWWADRAHGIQGVMAAVSGIFALIWITGLLRIYRRYGIWLFPSIKNQFWPIYLLALGVPLALAVGLDSMASLPILARLFVAILAGLLSLMIGFYPKRLRSSL